MPFIGRVTFSCPRRGQIVRRFIGPSSGEAVAKMFRPGLADDAGPGCKIIRTEIIRRGPGAGAVDRPSTMEGSKRRKRRRKKR